MHLRQLFNLAEHGPDTYIGAGFIYPWGGLYGGHIVAQSLRAAALTVEQPLLPHSLRAYFIRRGDHAEPVRYEVDRIRNGRSFATRRVVARQSNGAILNLEASFQVTEEGPDVQTVTMPDVPAPESADNTSWTDALDRRFIAPEAISHDPTTGIARSAAWVRAVGDIDDDPLVHLCALAYISDDLPADAARLAHPLWPERQTAHATNNDDGFYIASLDHTIWFHRQVRADAWHLYDVTCHNLVGNRGLTVGHVFTSDGVHVATIAQEVLIRDARKEVSPDRLAP
jgi:acyl-CoA thioesterase II